MIDALTKAVYGYVVARNSYGSVQVVPMYAVLSQIQSFMEVIGVSISQHLETYQFSLSGDMKVEASESSAVDGSSREERHVEEQTLPAPIHHELINHHQNVDHDVGLTDNSTTANKSDREYHPSLVSTIPQIGTLSSGTPSPPKSTFNDMDSHHRDLEILNHVC